MPIVSKCILVIATLILVLTSIGAIITILGGGHINYDGYPDEWDSKKCEGIYTIVCLASVFLMVILIVLSIILILTSS